MFRAKKQSTEPRRPLRSVAPRSASNVFAYHEFRSSREEQGSRQSPVTRPRARVWHARRWGVAIVILLLIAGLTDATYLGAQPRVVVTGQSSELQPAATYQQAASAAFEKSWSSHNKLTLDTQGIAAQLARKFPDLADVSVTVPILGHQPTVTLQLAPAVLLLRSTAGTDYAIDASGKAVAAASAIPSSDRANLALVQDQSGLPIKAGVAALPAGNVAFIQTVAEQFRAQHLTMTQLTLPKGASELDVHVGGKPYFVKFNLQADASQQLGTMLATMKYLQQKNVTPAQYLDVRVLGRAYYK